jgi:hypothetical protein
VEQKPNPPSTSRSLSPAKTSTQFNAFKQQHFWAGWRAGRDNPGLVHWCTLGQKPLFYIAGLPYQLITMNDITLNKTDADRLKQTCQRDLAGLKHVKFKPDNLTLLVNIGYWYEVDLERCNDSAQLLDWIFQVAGKLDRNGAEVVWEFLHALNLVSCRVFGHCVQGAFCPFGKGYEVDWKNGSRKESK